MVLSLGLGIAANTTVFTLINTVLLKELPVAEPDRLVLFSVRGGDQSFSYPLYQEFREQTRALSGVLASGGPQRMRLAVTGPGGRQQSEAVRAQPVSGNFFSVLGINAIEGRTLRADDDEGADPRAVVVLSERYWTRRFGRDPAIVGRTITLDEISFTVVGVAPPGFLGIQVGANPDLWWPVRTLPLMRPESESLLQPGNSWLLLMGRLAPMATRAGATAEMDVVFQRDLAERVRVREGTLTARQRSDLLSQSLELQPGSTGWTYLRPQFTGPLFILMALVAVVLLIACVNIANLRLVGGMARQQELAMRVALGASRRRVVVQLLTESLLLAAAGGVLGLLTSLWATRVLVTYMPAQPGALDVTPDTRVLVFTAAVTLVTGMVFGVAPAFRATHTNAARRPVLRSTTSDALVVAQLALCVSLLVGAGLFTRTLQNLRDVELGFVPPGLTVFDLDVPRNYDAQQRLDVYEKLRNGLEMLPDVRSATFSVFGLLGGSRWVERLEFAGHAGTTGEVVDAQGVLVSPRFFETLGTPLLRGRELLPDGRDADRSAVVNDTMARRYFGGRSPLGETFRIRGWSGGPFEVVGVVPDSKYRTLRDEPTPTFYVHPSARPQLGVDVRFEVRAAGAAIGLSTAIDRAADQVDPRIDVVELRTMSDAVDFTLLQERLVANLASGLGLVALLLAAIGLYGVTAYTVTQRTSEIGIRVALGAQRASIMGLVLRRNSVMTAIGIALGLAGAAVITRYVEAMLFGVAPVDPLTFVSVALGFGAIALLAAFLPARRATKVDPLTALRCE